MLTRIAWLPSLFALATRSSNSIRNLNDVIITPFSARSRYGKDHSHRAESDAKGGTPGNVESSPAAAVPNGAFLPPHELKTQGGATNAESVANPDSNSGNRTKKRRGFQVLSSSAPERVANEQVAFT